MNDGTSPKPTAQPADLLRLATGYCTRVSSDYDAVLRVQDCRHLPALPGEIDQVDNWTALAEIKNVAVSLAEALTHWNPETPQPCACTAAPLTAQTGHMWAALARTLAEITTQPDDRNTGRIAASSDVLNQRLTNVKAMTHELTGRIIEARAFADIGTDLVKEVFDRAAAAGCVHIPAAVTGERIPTSLSAINRLRSIARDTHTAFEIALTSTGGDSDQQDAEPQQCCSALPAPISAALAKLTRTWAEVLQNAWLYAARGETQTDTAMREAACRLGVAVRDLLTQF